MFTLQNSINFARTFVEYIPVTAGFGMEPAVSIGTIIRNSLLSAPQAWFFNRTSTTFKTVKGQQDYQEPISNLGYVEKVSLTDDQGNIYEIKDVYNNMTLGVSAFQQRPNAMSLEGLYTTSPVSISLTNVVVASNVLTISTASTAGLSIGDVVTFSNVVTATFLNTLSVVVTGVTANTSFTAALTHANYSASDTGTATKAASTGVVFRFLGVPDQIYTVTVTYQKLSAPFGPYFVSSVATTTGVYTGTFDPVAFPAGSSVTFTGFTTSANNGTFTVIATTPTSMTTSNNASVSETVSAFAVNQSWSPIPDQFSDIYNNLFLSEIFVVSDDVRAQVYRARGIAAFMSKSVGLSETQKNAFVQQWIARGTERQSVAQTTQQGNLGRSV